MTKPILRLILGDQLNINHSWFKTRSNKIEYIMMEVESEASYVTHHIQKILAFFLAMRHFRDELTSMGHVVHYLSLDDVGNRHSLSSNIREFANSGCYSALEYQEPDEHRVAAELLSLSKDCPIPVSSVSSEHFLTTQNFFSSVFKGHKRYTMELFYREVRKKYGILMDGDKPLGDRWNFDSENRDKLPKEIVPPPPLEFPRDISDLVELLNKQNIRSIGSVKPGRFLWPVTRKESLKTLEYFCKSLLPHFGAYQDAMHTDHRTLYHSRLSFALNVKLISPLEVIETAVRAFEKSKGAITLPQIEGFVRQIAGWREFMRGVYWNHMPSYKKLNFLEASRPLPHYFWNADTKMNCIRHAVGQSLEDSYAHHIQRLMITGNFCTLAGINPDQVDDWYLGIYLDAIEWVQLPNTRGMSQFADGGIVGTKPYTSSAQYINKMSNYCSGCYYNYKEKFGERGCPFNSLYWDFLMRNHAKLERNPRIGMGYQLLAKMSDKEKKAISTRAADILKHIEEL